MKKITLLFIIWLISFLPSSSNAQNTRFALDADFYFNGEKISGTKTSIKDVSGHMLRSKFDVTVRGWTDR